MPLAVIVIALALANMTVCAPAATGSARDVHTPKHTTTAMGSRGVVLVVRSFRIEREAQRAGFYSKKITIQRITILAVHATPHVMW